MLEAADRDCGEPIDGETLSDKANFASRRPKAIVRLRGSGAAAACANKSKKCGVAHVVDGKPKLRQGSTNNHVGCGACARDTLISRVTDTKRSTMSSTGTRMKSMTWSNCALSVARHGRTNTRSMHEQLPCGSTSGVQRAWCAKKGNIPRCSDQVY